MRRELTALVGLLLLLWGCSGESFHQVSLDQGTSLTTDARQRLISNVSPGVASRPGRVDPVRLICVEPSPDVAVAVASSLGAGLGLAGKASFSVSGSSAEGLAQLAERTTAIQAILKQGYQACLDYINGAISGTTYSLRQSRLDDLLVTLVLSENAAGAFGRSGAAIGTTGDATARATASLLPDVSKGLEVANADLAEKQKAAATKENELAAAEKALQDNADDTQTETLTATRDAKKAELDVAIAERDAALRSVTGLTEAATSAAAGVSKVVGQGGLDARADAEIAKVIAGMQETYVNKDIEQAYISTCLIELGQWKTPDASDQNVRTVAAEAVQREGGLTRDNAQGFFSAHLIGIQTRLTQHCEENLDTVLARAQMNSHNRKVMALEIEAKRLDIEKIELAKASTALGEGVHPLRDFNAAVAAKAALEASKAALEETPVPAASPDISEEQAKRRQQLDDRRSKALQAAQSLIDEATTVLSATEKTASMTFENTYIELIADTRRDGSEQDRGFWSDEFEAQQKQAAVKSRVLRDYIRRADAARAEADSLVRNINRFKEETAPQS